MSSNLDEIVEGIAAQLRTITALKHVLAYYPPQPGPLPMIYLDVETMSDPGGAWSAMTTDWGIAGYLVLAPVVGANEAAAAALARQLIPQIVFTIGHDMDAHGALANPGDDSRDGQVLLTDISRPGHVIIGKTPYHARRITFQAIESYTYEYQD